MPGDEASRMERVQRGEDLGMRGDVPDAYCTQRDEPEHHHRAEQHADKAGALLLDEEEADENRGGERHDIGLEGRGADFQSFDCREHRDRGREHRIAVKERRAEHADEEEGARPLRVPLDRRGRHREQRHDAALAAVVRPQHEYDVFQRHHDHQDPEDGREPADDVCLVERNAVLRIERLFDGVERARADVAVHHAERKER